jgi:hypothetical protein
MNHCKPIRIANDAPLLPVHNSIPSSSSKVTITSSNQAPASSNAPSGSRNTDQNTSTNIGDRAQQYVQQTSSDNTSSKSYLHWCVDSNPSDTLLFPLEIPQIDDVTIIQRLRSSYEAVKGIRRWISLTDCDGVKFVLVCSPIP